MRRLVRGSVLALAIAAMLVPPVAAVGADEREPRGAVTRRVRIVDNAFRPRTLRIDRGTRVKWVNTGLFTHTSTGSAWDSGQLGPGDSFRRRFRRAGTFTYTCTVHPAMRGSIVVT